MCSVPVVTSEAFEWTDGVVAVGAEVRHVPQAVHTEGDQATAVHTAGIKDTKSTGTSYILKKTDATIAWINFYLQMCLTYPIMHRPAHASQAMAPVLCSSRVTTVWEHTGQHVCTGTSPYTVGCTYTVCTETDRQAPASQPHKCSTLSLIR